MSAKRLAFPTAVRPWSARRCLRLQGARHRSRGPRPRNLCPRCPSRPVRAEPTPRPAPATPPEWPALSGRRVRGAWTVGVAHGYDGPGRRPAVTESRGPAVTLGHRSATVHGCWPAAPDPAVTAAFGERQPLESGAEAPALQTLSPRRPPLPAHRPRPGARVGGGASVRAERPARRRGEAWLALYGLNSHAGGSDER